MDEIVIALFGGHRQLVLGIGENARNGNCKRTEEQYRSGSGDCGKQLRLAPALLDQDF
jgi:Mrp family chromosome partitioning ATPase